MKSQVMSAAARKNIFLSPDAMEMVLSNSHPMEFINTVLTALSTHAGLVSKKDIMDVIAGDKALFESMKTITPRNKRNPDIQVLKSTDITGESTSEGKINDFANYFRSRYNSLKKIIEQRSDFGRSMPIAETVSRQNVVKIIGMIYEISETKNGHRIITVEDESATCRVLISKDSPCYNNYLVEDEVIGIEGKRNANRELFIADRIVHPDVSNHKWEPSDSVSSVAFLSDVHVGSYTFLESQWKKMIRWLKQNSEERCLDYIVFPGDIVDGIGVFPDQEKELVIDDIFKQYEALGEYLKDIPDHIKMVIHPGNHDAVRLAEPQPALSEAYRSSFDSNISMVGNPIYMKIEGRTVLSYHGKSIDDWISSVRGLNYEDPVSVMECMCLRRHLSPMYGKKNALSPEKKDYLVMDAVPDIFVSGHVHGAGTKLYNGVRLINASSWQDQTEYQKMHNFNPDPAIMPVVHLGTGRTEMLDFMKS